MIIKQTSHKTQKKEWIRDCGKDRQSHVQPQSIRSYKLSDVEIAKKIEAAVTEKLEQFEGRSDKLDMAECVGRTNVRNNKQKQKPLWIEKLEIQVLKKRGLG